MEYGLIHETASEKDKKIFFSNYPSKLCKYRIWENDFHKKVLLENELYFSSPKHFNDPYDCGLPFKQHPDNLDPVLIKEKVESTVLDMFPELVNNKKDLEEKCARQVLLIQQDPESWFEMSWGYRPEELSKIFGILSLTPHSDNYLMWSHYSNSHEGFCVEFDTRMLVESIAGHFQKVKYTDDIPFFSIMDNLEVDLAEKLIYTKSKIWEYEDEYRLSRINNPDIPVKFNPEALTGIYFGCKTSYEDMIEIIEIADKTFPNVAYRKMELDKQNFKLIEGKIPLF